MSVLNHEQTFGHTSTLWCGKDGPASLDETAGRPQRPIGKRHRGFVAALAPPNIVESFWSGPPKTPGRNMLPNPNSLLGTGHLRALGNRGGPCTCPSGTEQGLVTPKIGRHGNEERNSCERSCVRHGYRIGHRRWTNRVQRADILFLRLEVQGEVRPRS